MKTWMLLSCCLLAASAARAADAGPKETMDRARMAERHEKLAEAHRKAAECLKGAKTEKECHDEMMKDAPAGGWHGEGCEMRGHKRMGKGGKGMPKVPREGAAPERTAPEGAKP